MRAYEVFDVRADDDPSLHVVPRIASFEEMLQTFPITVYSIYGWDAAPAGRLVWKVVGFEIRTGVAAYIPQFKRGNAGVNLVRVARSWPGAPPAEGGEVLHPDYPGKLLNLGYETNHGVAGWTNVEGTVGFGYSHGSMVNVGQTGPDMIWPLIPATDEPRYSDCVVGLGWITGTNHLNINPIWELVTKPQDGPQPPTPGGYELRVIIGGEFIGVIPIEQSQVPADNKILLLKDGLEVGTILIV
jgi:hypothetical protein